MRRATSQASSTLVAVPLAGQGIASSSSSLPNSLRSSARSIFSGSVPMIGTPSALQRQRQVERRLPAELHDHAVGLFGVADVEHVLERQRLEVEAVAGVVIGRDGLGIAVDHDRFDAHFLQRERRVAAAVIELDALPDAVGPAAQNHDLLAVAGVGFAGAFVDGIEIRREAFELRRAGVHAVEDGAHAQLLAAVAHGDLDRRSRSWRAARRRCRSAWRCGSVSVGTVSSGCPRQAPLRNPTTSFICSRNHGSMAVSSWISSTRVAAGEGEADVVQPVGRGRDQLLRDQVRVEASRSRRPCRFPGCACLSTALL